MSEYYLKPKTFIIIGLVILVAGVVIGYLIHPNPKPEPEYLPGTVIHSTADSLRAVSQRDSTSAILQLYRDSTNFQKTKIKNLQYAISKIPKTVAAFNDSDINVWVEGYAAEKGLNLLLTDPDIQTDDNGH